MADTFPMQADGKGGGGKGGKEYHGPGQPGEETTGDRGRTGQGG